MKPLFRLTLIVILTSAIIAQCGDKFELPPHHMDGEVLVYNDYFKNFNTQDPDKNWIRAKKEIGNPYYDEKIKLYIGGQTKIYSLTGNEITTLIFKSNAENDGYKVYQISEKQVPCDSIKPMPGNPKNKDVITGKPYCLVDNIILERTISNENFKLIERNIDDYMRWIKKNKKEDDYDYVSLIYRNSDTTIDMSLIPLDIEIFYNKFDDILAEME